MRPPRPVLFPAVLAALALAAGCSSDHPTSPGAELSQGAADDIAVQLGQSLAAGNGGVLSELAAAAASVPSFAPAGGLESAAAASETTFTVGAVTYTFTRDFFDAQGGALPGYGPTAVRLVVTSRATGAIARPHFTAGFARAGSLTVLGVAPGADTLQFDGTAHDTLNTHFDALDQTRTSDFHWLDYMGEQRVRLLRDRTANPWPLSGTLAYIVVAERPATGPAGAVQARYEVLLTVDFDGTATPLLTIESRFRYRVDLGTGAVTRA